MREQGATFIAIRQLRPDDEAKLKKVRADKGFAAAIAEARPADAGSVGIVATMPLDRKRDSRL
jgi:hypothetical protein